jgi:hypothetical protein
MTDQEMKLLEAQTILLTKIKLLEKQLTQIQAERDNLKQLAQTEKQRADQAEQQLKTTSKLLHQWQKLNYYQQLEKQKAEMETKIIQPLPLKVE